MPTINSQKVSDQRIDRVVPLISPAMLHHELPLDGPPLQTVLQGRKQVRDVIDKLDDRIVVVVGPCSVHDTVAGLEYADRLATVAQRLSDDLMIVMRVYFEKPRTVVGWKGLINDPRLDGSGDVNLGLRTARQFLLGVLERGLPAGCEFVDPITPQYIADMVCWGAIGARTVESQVHRQLASGLSMPLGMKNRPDGSIATAVDAILAAAAPHVFAGIDFAGAPAVFHTRGNADCHLVLRGGQGGPNYGAEHVARAVGQLRTSGLPSRVVVDASHDNSGKNHDMQPVAAAAVARQIADGATDIVGLMLESFLVAGRQDLIPGQALTHGQSITDACIDWDTTQGVLENLAAAVRQRRGCAASAQTSAPKALAVTEIMAS